jgi:hypothetical protein
VSGKKLYRSNFNQVADCLRIKRDEIMDALDNWTPEQLHTHLSQFPAAVLDSHEQLRTFEQFLDDRERQQQQGG